MNSNSKTFPYYLFNVPIVVVYSFTHCVVDIFLIPSSNKDTGYSTGYIRLDFFNDANRCSPLK